MKNILITGSGGFIGGHLLWRLVADDNVGEIHAIVRQNSLVELIPSVDYYAITPDSYKDFLPALENVDVVYHLAAKYTGRDEDADLDLFLKDNIDFTAKLLKACSVMEKPPAFVYATTFSTDAGLQGQPQTLYAASKAATEEIAKYYAPKVPVTFVRIAETYHPEDTRPKVHNILRDKILAGESEFTFMKPEWQKISMLHVDDVVEIFCNFEKYGHYNGLYREIDLTAPNTWMTLGEMARAVARHSDIVVRFPETETPGNEVTPIPQRDPSVYVQDFQPRKDFIKAVKG